MRRVGVLTSGGDAPGMNAAIRAVVRTGIEEGWEVVGIRHGYAGLIAGETVPLGVRDVGGIIQHGGTILSTARSREFETEKGRRRALTQLERFGIEALVVIGGNGSQSGSLALSEMGMTVVGVASTIDNDLYGSDVTIGVDTALNVALEAIDRLKVTASSLQRAFLVEVMGRECGYLAMMAGITGGAEAIVIPELETDPDELAAGLRAAYRRGKAHALVVVAEGARHNAREIERHFAEYRGRIGFELRVTTLGHVQRGGTPSFSDRLLATRLGSAATAHLARGEHGVMVGIMGGRVTGVPLSEVAEGKKTPDSELMELASVLAR